MRSSYLVIVISLQLIIYEQDIGDAENGSCFRSGARQ